jgi:hypothetical protein
MTYVPGLEFGEASAGGGAYRHAAAIERRVDAALGTCQTLLVVRILSVLLGVSLLPLRLPTVVFRLDPTHEVILPLNGINRGMVLLVVAAVSALELYLVYRLADRVRRARAGVLLIESCAIVLTTIAVAFGAEFAALPLVTAVGATSLLLLNQVRWAFVLPPKRRNLTGRRQTGGTYAGYAAPGLEFPKTPQRVGYVTRRDGQGGADAAAPRGEIAAVRPDRAAAPRSESTRLASPLAWPTGSHRRHL